MIDLKWEIRNIFVHLGIAHTLSMDRYLALFYFLWLSCYEYFKCSLVFWSILSNLDFKLIITDNFLTSKVFISTIYFKIMCLRAVMSMWVQVPVLELQVVLRLPTWVLGSELQSSGRGVFPLTSWAIFPVLKNFLIFLSSVAM